MLPSTSTLRAINKSWFRSISQQVLYNSPLVTSNTLYTSSIHTTAKYTTASVSHPAKMEDEILTETKGSLGIITMNRPKALNSLNLNMVDRLYNIYTSWQAPNSPVTCILLTGAGGKAFCAGGDVKSVVLSAMANDPSPGLDFFRSEYRTDYCISQLRNPHIAILNGITMGGGAGISMHGSFRVATEKTLFAMPECGIGLFPDVGASHFLRKLPGALGSYLALTGARLKGAEMKEAGLATHYIPSHRLPDAVARLQQLGSSSADLSLVNAALCEAEALEVPPPPSQLLRRLPVINHCFGDARSVEQIVAALESSSSEAEFCEETLRLLRKGSPLSVEVTLEMLHRTRTWQLPACLQLDFQLAVRFTRGEGDFYEGVRATLIDKGSTPRWKFPTLQDVPQEVVEAFFQPLVDVDGLQLPMMGSGLTGCRL